MLEAEGRADEAEDKVRINYNRGEIPPPVFLRDTTTDRAARFSTR